MTRLHLPSEHPIARAIMNAGVEDRRVFLTVESWDPAFEEKPQHLRLEVVQWTSYAATFDEPARLDVRLIDPVERLKELENLTKWPTP